MENKQGCNSDVLLNFVLIENKLGSYLTNRCQLKGKVKGNKIDKKGE